MVLRILLVEDDESNAQILRVICEHAGFEVAVIHDGEQALSFLERHAIDLLITDIQLPGLDGVQLIRQIRDQDRLAGLPIISVTARAYPDQQAEIRAAGASALLTKPFRRRELLAMINRVLGQNLAE